MQASALVSLAVRLLAEVLVGEGVLVFAWFVRFASAFARGVRVPSGSCPVSSSPFLVEERRAFSSPPPSRSPG